MERPRTVEEIAALPIGPLFGTVEYTCTKEDHQRGFMVVGEKRLAVDADCQKVIIPVAPHTTCFYSEVDDVVGYTDDEGVFWMLGRYMDGRWFRQRG